MLIIWGPGSERIGRDIAAILGFKGSGVMHRTFPDGESYLRIPVDVRDRRVVLIQSTAPPQDTRLIQLLLILDALGDQRASDVVLVIPYLAYARQDRSRLDGEAVSIYTVIKLLEGLGVTDLVTVNVHNPEAFEGSSLRLQDLSAIPSLARHLAERGFEGCLSISLGKKEVDVEHARNAASILGGGYGVLKTFRDPVTGEVSIIREKLSVKGERVVIVDDVITSGETHLKAVDFLREKGAREVHLACVHSLLKEEGLARVKETADSFVTSDTIPNPCSEIGVAPIIAEALARYHR
jgi:ribose-phosphate pyrophosphokinase